MVVDHNHMTKCNRENGRVWYARETLIKMTLEGTWTKVQVEGELTEEFDVQRGLRQGDVLSTILFNLALEKAVRQMPINPGGTIFNRGRPVVEIRP